MNADSLPSLPSPIVALVTNRALVGGEDALVEAVEQAVANGVNLVQMREKDLPDAAQLALARRLRRATEGKALLFVNDSLSVAEACGADGVHLGERSRSVAAVRAAASRPLLAGRSAHEAEGARAAAEQGAALIVAGAVYASPTHPGQVPAGVGLVSACAAAVGVPVVAIGGVTAENAGAAMRAGASGVAVISAVLGAPRPGEAAAELAAAVRMA